MCYWFYLIPLEIIFLLQLDSLTQNELASRLTLNCMNCYVEPQKISQLPITIMDVSVLWLLFFFVGKIRVNKVLNKILAEL